MAASHTAVTYRRPSIIGAAFRGAIAGPLAALFVLGALAVTALVGIIGFFVVVMVVLSHLPANAIPAP